MHKFFSIILAVLIVLASVSACFADDPSGIKVGFAAGQEIKNVAGTFLGGLNINAAPSSDVYTYTADGTLDYTVKTSGVFLRAKAGEKIGTITLIDDYGCQQSAELIATNDAHTPAITLISLLLLIFLLVLTVKVQAKNAKRRMTERQQMREEKEMKKQ